MIRRDHQFKPDVKHLLVDLDGTLLGNHQVPLSFHFVSKAIGILKKQVGLRKAAKILYSINEEFKKPSRHLTNDIRVVQLFSKHLNISIEEGRLILRKALSVIFPEMKKHFYPIPGALEFLDWAKDRFPLTLATNPVWPLEIIELRVKWAGIDPSIFGLITDAKTMHACKPTAEYYKEILKLQKLKPAECLLIGNERKMDLPAINAGIRVFIVGPYKTLTPLTPLRSRVPAWQGSFKDLKGMLK